MEINLINFFLQIQSQLKVFHWQTESYARHMAYGRIYDSLDDKIDAFIEIYQGKHKRIKVEKSIVLVNISEPDANKFIDSTLECLINQITPTLDEKKDGDLKNLLDEIVGEFNTLKYLLSLS